MILLFKLFSGLFFFCITERFTASLLKTNLTRVHLLTFAVISDFLVGVGGFVVNDNGEVLTVKEKYSGTNAAWKYPGGGTELGK